MPESRANAAAAAKKASRAAAKPHSIAAKDEQARVLAERRKLARAAAQAAFENGVGAKAVLKSDQFKERGLTYNMVHPFLVELNGRGKNARLEAPRDHHKQILTTERLALADWILACR